MTGRWIAICAVYASFVVLMVLILRGYGNLMHDFGVLKGQLDCIDHNLGRLNEALPKQ
jgi:hypothetical protein